VPLPYRGGSQLIKSDVYTNAFSFGNNRYCQFCYLCRARWKTCSCPQWDERRLTAAAEDRVQRQFGIQLPPAQPPPLPLQRAQPAPVPAPVNNVTLNQRTRRENPAVPRETRQQAVRQWVTTNAVVPMAPARPRPAINVATPEASRRHSVAVVASGSGSNSAQAERRSSSTRTTAARPVSTFITPSTKEDSRSGKRQSQPPSDTTTPTAAHTHNRTSLTFDFGSATSSSVSQPKSWRNSPLTSPTSTSFHDIGAMPPTPSSSKRTLDHDLHNNKWTRPKPRNDGAVELQRWRTLVNETMNDLRVNHECTHQLWQYRSGGGRCQTCHDMLPIYLLVCFLLSLRSPLGYSLNLSLLAMSWMSAVGMP
jgi:hypothetical protein